MLNIQIKAVLASDRDKSAQYEHYENLRAGDLFLHNALVHVKGTENEAINIHTGQIYDLHDRKFVIKIHNPLITGTFRVQK